MKKFGIIIAIEEYSSAVVPQLNAIEFAINDANSIKKVFQEQFYIEDRNLVFLTNESASKSSIEKEVRGIFKELCIDDECYFYYVGHGFNAKLQNRITCWDTDNLCLEETSLSLEEILLEPLRKVQCQKSFIFIDSSAEELKAKNKLKTLASNLIESEYSELVRKHPFYSFFLSCYPGEKSFNAAKVKHGIWAYHLINALNGKDDSAIDRDNAITNSTLAKYLSTKIPEYITIVSK